MKYTVEVSFSVHYSRKAETVITLRSFAEVEELTQADNDGYRKQNG